MKKFYDWISKSWKWLVGIVTAIFLLLIARRKDEDWREFHEDSKKNLKKEIDAINISNEKEREAVDKAEDEFKKALDDLRENLEEKSEKIEKQKNDAKKKIESTGVAKSIAEATGADFIKEEE